MNMNTKGEQQACLCLQAIKPLVGGHCSQPVLSKLHNGRPTMKAFRLKPLYILFAIQALLMIGFLIVCNDTSSESLPSNYIGIEEICRPGEGLPRAEVLLVRGSVVIIREKISHSCWAKKNLSLFNQDIISTQENGRVRFGFIDGSLVTLSSMTELEITRNIYDRAAKTRSLFFNMHSGKARFYVFKLDDLEFSEANVKTKTAIVVATGSDFFIEGTDQFTKVIAFEDTRLEIISLAAPEADPVVIKDYEQVVVKEGDLPSGVKKTPQEEIKRILKEFEFEEMNILPPGVIKYKDIFFPEERLVEPDVFLKPGKEELFSEPIEDPWSQDKEIPEDTFEIINEIPENINERMQRESLPQFPEHP